ncbi:MAG: thioesterase family protein [Nocardioides sp.]|nr:thioesterase family protein [Nocardioides sp.]
MSHDRPREVAFFVREGDALVPTSVARSSWSASQMHGVAVSGALGRAAERGFVELGRPDLRPARLVVDLFRPALMAPCLFVTEVVREGNRICLVDVTLVQDGRAVARAALTGLAVSATTDGEVWSSPHRPSPPPLHLAPPTDTPHPSYLRSSGDWTADRTAHQNAAHKMSWNSPPGVVAGEPRTPFQTAATMADGSNLVVNWGSLGVEHINSDVTLSLARLPRGTEVGLSALDRVESEGICVGTATMFDREGPIGTVVLTAIANALRTVSPSVVLEP